MKVTQLPQNLIDQIKQLQQNKIQLYCDLGEIEIQKTQLQQKKDQLRQKYQDIVDEENTLGQYISQEFGDGTLDLDTGTLTPLN